MTDNPYRQTDGESNWAPTSSNQRPGRIPNAYSSENPLFSSKPLAAELAEDDAAMAGELAALAPQAARHAKNETMSSTTLHDGSRTQKKNRNEGALFTDTRDVISTDEFVRKKREVGLVRMSLASKKAEIRKLEDEMNRAEKRLHQQEEQLDNTREKFNNFLKHSNLEQDAAVRRADHESRAKQEKTVEIKKLSALIGRVELELKKLQIQIDNCRAYKRFLNDLTKPKWFSDLLISLRVEDETKKIVTRLESDFERKAEALVRAHEAAEAAAAEQERLAKEKTGKRGAPVPTVAASGTKPEPPVEDISLEQKLYDLQQEMEAAAQAEVDDMTAAVTEEVSRLSAEKVRRSIDEEYDENRIPMYFKDVNDMLEVFINVEEGNLFLIQNCQELEEELEAVAMDCFTEQTEMASMTQQRQGQMRVLAEKIGTTREKLQQLDERAGGLQGHPQKPNTASGQATTAGGGAAKKAVSTSAREAAQKAQAADLPPEVLKPRMEQLIAGIFASLTRGDQQLKSLLSSLKAKEAQQAAARVAGPPEDEDGDTDFDGTTRSRASVGTKNGGDDSKNTTFMARTSGSATNGRQARGGTGAKPPKTSKTATRKVGAGPGGGGGATTTAAGGGHTQDDQSNIGSVEMLTIVENKLEWYHRYIMDPTNGVEDGLVQAVMKASDKERRRQARQVHMAKQAAEQEERVRRALERSQAPVAKKTGKPVFLRSHYVKEESAKEKKARQLAAREEDEDGAEFFQ